MYKIIFLLSLVLLIINSVNAQSTKLTAADVIAKHLASIGTPDAIANVKSRVMIGEGQLMEKTGSLGHARGPAQLASDGDKLLLAMILNSNDYPYEKIGFDGKKMSVARPLGKESPLVYFLKSQGSIVKDGFFTGVLSAAWPLLDSANSKIKFSYNGTEMVGGRLLHKLKFTDADLQVTLFFEDNTFRHVATRYYYSIQPAITHTDTAAGQLKTSYYTMTEKFSEFKVYGGLTLPSSYSIDVSLQVEGGAIQAEWRVNVKEVYYNQALEAASFRVS